MGHAELVASLIVLRQKIHSCHWEVTGINFMELHLLFNKQYDEVLTFADRVAEYMRTIDQHPPSTLDQMLELSFIGEIDVATMIPLDMCIILRDDFLLLANYVQDMPNIPKSWGNIAGELHEYLMKQYWFMRSFTE